MEAHRYDALKTMETRPEFYRKLYRVMLKAVFINSIILSALCILTIYLSFYGFKREHYFSSSRSGKIIELRYTIIPHYPKPSPESLAAHGQPAPAKTQ